MEPTAESPSVWRCAVKAIPAGQTAKFRLIRRGKPLEGFIVNVDGRYHAYVNRCPHAGTPLDTWPNEFLSEDGQRLRLPAPVLIGDIPPGSRRGPFPG